MNGPAQPATQPTADEVRSAAADVLSDQHPEAKAIYEKQTRGEPLTQREWGIVGWIKKRLAGKSDAPGKPTDAGTGNSPDMAAVAADETGAQSLPDAPADPGIVRRTTGAIVGRLENRDRRKVAVLCEAAKQLGADTKTLARIERATVLPSDDKNLLLDLSPDVFKEWGIDPRKYATVVVLGLLSLWRLDMYEAIEELRTIVKGKAPEPQPAAKTAYTFPHNDLRPVVPEGKPTGPTA